MEVVWPEDPQGVWKTLIKAAPFLSFPAPAANSTFFSRDGEHLRHGGKALVDRGMCWIQSRCLDMVSDGSDRSAVRLKIAVMITFYSYMPGHSLEFLASVEALDRCG